MGLITEAVSQIEAAYTGIDDKARAGILETIGAALQTITGSRASDDEQIRWFMIEVKEALAPFKNAGIVTLMACATEIVSIKKILAEHAPIILEDLSTYLKASDSDG